MTFCLRKISTVSAPIDSHLFQKMAAWHLKLSCVHGPKLGQRATVAIGASPWRLFFSLLFITKVVCVYWKKRTVQNEKLSSTHLMQACLQPQLFFPTFLGVNTINSRQTSSRPFACVNIGFVVLLCFFNLKSGKNLFPETFQ